MKRYLPWLLVGALSACAAPAEPVDEAVTLDAEWKAYILPRPAEVGHEVLPWLPTFGEGFLAASEAQKPLLFWAMNGHPLGCT